ARRAPGDGPPGPPRPRAGGAGAAPAVPGGDARTRYTRTGFRGHEAALADGVRGTADGPARVLQLTIRTDTGRMYELRVEMPAGGAPERKGAALFEGARDRLEIETRSAGRLPASTP
ncbi:hypothetical protein AB8O53_20530, partial [Streptomyces pilosus]